MEMRTIKMTMFFLANLICCVTLFWYGSTNNDLFIETMSLPFFGNMFLTGHIFPKVN
jgi:hypothetical protein